jgi:hypothetical protein
MMSGIDGMEGSLLLGESFVLGTSHGELFLNWESV